MKHGWLSSLVGLLAPVAACIGAATLTGGCGDDSDGSGGSGGGVNVDEITPGPAGIRRLTTSQMKYSVEYLLGSDAAATFDLWTDPQLKGFESIAAAELSLSANDVSNLELTVGVALDTSLADPTHLAGFAPCISASPNEACYGDVIDQFVSVAWRRPVEADERTRLLAIASQGQDWASGDFDAGLRYMLSAVFQSPNFLYQAELGESAGLRTPLAPYERAARLSFFLNHQTPDVELLEAAKSGKLETDAGVREQAERLLAKPEARRAMDRFFSELYLIREVTDVTKDPLIEPNWNDALAASMQEEMLRFLADIVWAQDGDIRDMFNSTETFVNPLLADFYGVQAAAGGWQKVELPTEGERQGIFGKAGLMAKFAHPDGTSPTKRGRFFRERFMCRSIPAPPPGVDASLPDGDFKTMRERLEAHLQPSCASCHELMDPIGLAFEHFDTVGRYRETDNGEPIITEDSSGNLNFKGPADLAKIARDSSPSCFVSHFLRQAMGRVEIEGEAAAIREIEKNFADSGYRIQDLMIEIVASPAFLNVGLPK